MNFMLYNKGEKGCSRHGEVHYAPTITICYDVNLLGSYLQLLNITQLRVRCLALHNSV